MEIILYGILTGSILLLGSIGMSIIRKVQGHMDMSYAQYMMLSAFLTWQLTTKQKLPFILGALISIIFITIIAYIVFKVVYKPIKTYGPTMLLFTTVGVNYIINGGAKAIWGVKTKAFALGLSRSINIGETRLLTSREILVIIIAWLAALVIHLVMTRTKVGKALRAMASNYDLAQVRGIDTGRMSSFVFVISGSLAGLSGVLLGMIGSLYPDMGTIQILLILSAVVMGGLSAPLSGVMAAAMIIGLGMEISTLFLRPAYRPAVALVLFVLTLFIKPEGLFTKQTRKVKFDKKVDLKIEMGEAASVGGQK
ncbi:MAG: branched-chain amino acid ABC transporter permease [Clostridiales bacterium]|nr:branched-chain amino acid ABC transporter permease [Clostridiales bacterium]